MMVDYRKILSSGIDQLSLPFNLSSTQVEQLLNYHLLMIKWNGAYNLTAVRDPVAMLSRHLLDSLSIAPHLFKKNTGQRFIDVGTGAGLPGIVLAILYPENDVHLLDSNGKKTRFLFQVKTELGLDNITVHHSRVEQHSAPDGYDGILSRAFATLEDMITGSEHLLSNNGSFFAMKGIYPELEIQRLSSLKKPYKVSACHQLFVPGEEGERHLIVISAENS